MPDIKKSLSTGFKILLGIAAIIVVLLIIWGAVELANNLPESVKSIGATATTTPIQAPAFLDTIITVILGDGANLSWESLILYLAIFAILFFALSDIVSLFSTFTEATSWVIGFGLAVIAGVTNIIHSIAGIFAITAGIGAIGISIIIIAAVGAAVILNLGIGGPLRKWQHARQVKIDKFKAERGFGKVTSFIKGAKEGAETAGAGEKAK